MVLFIFLKKLVYIFLGICLAFFIKETNETLLDVVNIKTTLFIILFESFTYIFKISKILKNKIDKEIEIFFKNIYKYDSKQKLKKLLRQIYIRPNELIKAVRYYSHEFITIVLYVLMIIFAFLISKLYLFTYTKWPIKTTILITIIFIVTCFLEKNQFINELVDLENQAQNENLKKLCLIENILTDYQYKTFVDKCLREFQKKTIYEILTTEELLEIIKKNHTIKRNFLVFMSRYIDLLGEEKNPDFQKLHF